jgi:hypothetical protein
MHLAGQVLFVIAVVSFALSMAAAIMFAGTRAHRVAPVARGHYALVE